MTLRLSRALARLALLVATVIAVAIPVAALLIRGLEKPETWLVTGAALAVITSILSAWSSRRVVELHEDAQRPNVVPAFDFTSRYGLVMIRVKNTGATAGYKIELRWDRELQNHQGETIGFQNTDGKPSIVSLLPGESITQIIGTPHEFLARDDDTEYVGMIKFEDGRGHEYQYPFYLDVGVYKMTPTYENEYNKTLFELQKIPAALDKIRRSIKDSS